LATVGACHGDITIDPISNPGAGFGVNMITSLRLVSVSRRIALT